jgi:predicted NAD/FAD-dependent oxidoreductase
MTRVSRRIAVVGAGLAGPVAARRLVGHGHRVVVFDKGRGPGGRASTRRRERFAFDHGAQYFTARDERFRATVDAWLTRGIIATWTPRVVAFDPDGVRFAGGDDARYVGVPGMDQLGKHLARDLDLVRETRVARLERGQGGWSVIGEANAVLAESDAVLVTLPPAQAQSLLEVSPALVTRVSDTRMRPCWAVLLGFDEPVPVEYDAGFVNVGALGWVARNSSKPGRDGGEAWVLHASMDWSEEHLEAGPGDIIEELRHEFAHRCVDARLPEVAFADAHRWRYAQPDPALETACLYDPDYALGAGGDWCGGPRLEGAYLSGLALAARVLEEIARPWREGDG